MSSETFDIPKYGDAGVAFLGVEIGDAVIVLSSLFIGLLCGAVFGWGGAGYVGIPFGGYWLNRLFVDWKANTLPGQLRADLFGAGLWGYGGAFDSRATVFVGDAVVINPGSVEIVDAFALAWAH